MTWRKSYERWKQTEHLDPELKERLIELEGDEQALEDCFYKDLEFSRKRNARGNRQPGQIG